MEAAKENLQLLRPFDVGAHSVVVDPAAGFAAWPVAAAAFRSASAAAKEIALQAER